MRKFWENLSLTKKTTIILISIILIGFVFRAYHFSDWLRVNMDQARDTKLVETSIQENSWPALGPKAGGTEFALGPIFYYFQIISGKIFGANFVGVAYADLFFSLLSIPLFFLLAQIYFKKPLALSLTWFFAISYFVIKYSRFTWNPNSTPFFVMLFLYAIYNINKTSGNRKIWWAILAGVAMGVGVQLHTTLLIIMPISALIFAYYIYRNGKLTKICVIAVIFGSILVNTPQINTEIKTGGSNIRAFFKGAENKNSRNTNLADNLILNATCHVRANFGIAASDGREEECGYNDVIRNAGKLDGDSMPLSDKIILVFYILGATIFSIGGYFLFGRGWRREKDLDRKFFLKLIFSYTVLTFLFFTVWATELSMRFFLILEFVPFILLGFWLKFLAEKFKKQWLVVLIVLLFSFFCLQKDYAVFRDLQFGGREINGNFEYITLGEVNFIVNYIQDNNNHSNVAYLDAQGGYLFKAFKSLRFVANESGLELIELNKTVNLVSGDKLFYLKNAEDDCKLPDNIAIKYSVNKCVIYRQFSVFDLRVK